MTESSLPHVLARSAAKPPGGEAARTEDGLAYEDGLLTLRDGRELAWRWWGKRGGTPVLKCQGMPSSRVNRNPDPSAELELGVRYLMSDRPGYGGSTRKPGHGIADLADDMVALLDHHRLDRVPVIGGSAGGPQALALAARYPERVSAVSVVVGAAPLNADEAAGLVELNARGYLAKQKGWDEVFKLLRDAREHMLGEHDITFGQKNLPAVDRSFLARDAVQRIRREDLEEALRQGAEGWADESYAMKGDWDFNPADVRASVTWWHGDGDRNAPLSAARRAAARLPHAVLHVWRGEGHTAANEHEREILEELLGRASR